MTKNVLQVEWAIRNSNPKTIFHKIHNSDTHFFLAEIYSICNLSKIDTCPKAWSCINSFVICEWLWSKSFLRLSYFNCFISMPFSLSTSAMDSKSPFKQKICMINAMYQIKKWDKNIYRVLVQFLKFLAPFQKNFKTNDTLIERTNKELLDS